ncbi:mannitol dehydrogenase family protein [Citreicella sp. C3M06]|uniref:mannitol dehydrogenase family protein n=1 Tax=Citreicella sp. C3M06 TaxID=2841564 RepID=UPI001C08A205|nr:mannitol dehydrogenase family protein [Citreicella sp. C3M06]MBU2963284.1 mannitol dehydrogenase family protein [Citreicella sp. C3M06]
MSLISENTDKRVALPAYDRKGLSHGIVHVGLGNFHRAHQAVYLDDLFAKGLDHDWAITGAGVRAPDARMREALLAQDCLSTVIELSADSRNPRVTGSMIDYLPIEETNGPLIAKMADTATRIVSLTVTEGGYFVDPTTETFDPTHPDIVADGASPDAPRTVFGAIVAALKARRDAGQTPFTVMSCDNLPGNGSVTRDAVTGTARLSDPALADWIAANVAFPNSMVDRITPATGDRERAVAAGFGLNDPVPVTCEPFRQWVLEDSFTQGRPRLEEVGVTFTDHVHDYERMKIRILNGGHAIIAYAGALLGCTLVDEAMAHPLVHGFFRKVEETEVLPQVQPVPEFTATEYLELIVGRFSNPEVKDTLRRLCFDGSNRQPKFIVPVIVEALKADASIDGLALESALWCRYCAGQFEDGSVIEANDPDWTRLVALSEQARTRPAAWLEQRSVYGDLASNARFADTFAKWLTRLWDDGVEVTMDAYVKG